MITGFIQDAEAWARLLEWATAQGYYKVSEQSAPYRMRNVLRHSLHSFGAEDMERAKELLREHYGVGSEK